MGGVRLGSTLGLSHLFVERKEMNKDKIDKKIDICFLSITRLLIVIGVFGSGIAATIGYANFIKELFEEKILQLIFILEFATIASLIAMVFIKFLKIEKLNLKERGNV